MKRTFLLIAVLLTASSLAWAERTVVPGDLTKRTEVHAKHRSELIMSLRAYYEALRDEKSNRIRCELFGLPYCDPTAARGQAFEALRQHPDQVNDVIREGETWETPLLLAFGCGDYELAKALLDADALPCAPSGDLRQRIVECLRQEFHREPSPELMQLFDAAARRQNHLDNALKARAWDARQQTEATR